MTPRFIVGMSRSGTTWLMRALNAHPAIAAFGETLFWGRGWLPPDLPTGYSRARAIEFARAVTGRDLGLPDALEEELACSLGELGKEVVSVQDLFLCILRTVTRLEGKRVAVEKTPHHIHWADRILHHFPDALFVVLLRDPYGFMLSYKHQGDRKPDPSRRSFERLYHPIACSLLWRGYMNAASHLLRRAPGQALVIRSSYMRAHAGEVLEATQRFLGARRILRLAPDTDINSSFPGEARPELDPAEVAWMTLINRDVMGRWGFDVRRVTTSPPVLAREFLSLPSWARRNLTGFGGKVEGSALDYLRRWLQHIF